MRLHPDKTALVPSAAAQTFLGFELLPNGQRRLVPANVTRFRHRLNGLRDAWRNGQISAPEVQQRVRAWVAHARHANTAQLRHTLFRGGWFDPHWADGSPVKAASP